VSVAETVAAGGAVAPVAAPAGGCRFLGRCPRARDICGTVEPPLAAVREGQAAACHFPETGSFQ
jgi:oligopeptide/dipeptide ABC transporter ATP-binding protein